MTSLCDVSSDVCFCRSAVAGILVTTAMAAPVDAERSGLTGMQPNALLTIDRNRTTVVDRIVAEWGAALSRSTAGISSAQLHALLMGLRADHLLAASLAGSPQWLARRAGKFTVHHHCSQESTTARHGTGRYER